MKLKKYIEEIIEEILTMYDDVNSENYKDIISKHVEQDFIYYDKQDELVTELGLDDRNKPQFNNFTQAFSELISIIQNLIEPKLSSNKSNLKDIFTK